MSARAEKTFRAVCRWTDRLERLLLGLLIAGMVGLSAVQIVLRNVWHTAVWRNRLLGMACSADHVAPWRRPAAGICR
jgi:hypothetical protein